jgi:hypothetical protein
MDLHDFVEDVSVLIDGAPEIAFLTVDGDLDLIEMPYVMAAWRLSLQATGVIGAKFNGPASDRFVGHDNAALKKHFLDQTQAQGKSEIEPDRVCDDPGRKSVAFVADGTQGHGPVLSPNYRRRVNVISPIEASVRGISGRFESITEAVGKQETMAAENSEALQASTVALGTLRGTVDTIRNGAFRNLERARKLRDAIALNSDDAEAIVPSDQQSSEISGIPG